MFGILATIGYAIIFFSWVGMVIRAFAVGAGWGISIIFYPPAMFALFARDRQAATPFLVAMLIGGTLTLPNFASIPARGERGSSDVDSIGGRQTEEDAEKEARDAADKKWDEARKKLMVREYFARTRENFNEEMQQILNEWHAALKQRQQLLPLLPSETQSSFPTEISAYDMLLKYVKQDRIDLSKEWDKMGEAEP